MKPSSDPRRRNSNSKSSTPQAAPAAKPTVWRPPEDDVVRDGNLLNAPIWYEVGLSRDEVRILKALGNRLRLRRSHPACAAARLLIVWCLGHLEEIEGRLIADVLDCTNGWTTFEPACAWGPQIKAHAKALQVAGKITLRQARRN